MKTGRTSPRTTPPLVVRHPSASPSTIRRTPPNIGTSPPPRSDGRSPMDVTYSSSESSRIGFHSADSGTYDSSRGRTLELSSTSGKAPKIPTSTLKIGNPSIWTTGKTGPKSVDDGQENSGADLFARVGLRSAPTTAARTAFKAQHDMSFERTSQSIPPLFLEKNPYYARDLQSSPPAPELSALPPVTPGHRRTPSGSDTLRRSTDTELTDSHLADLVSSMLGRKPPTPVEDRPVAPLLSRSYDSNMSQLRAEPVMFESHDYTEYPTSYVDTYSAPLSREPFSYANDSHMDDLDTFDYYESAEHVGMKRMVQKAVMPEVIQPRKRLGVTSPSMTSSPTSSPRAFLPTPRSAFMSHSPRTSSGGESSTRSIVSASIPFVTPSATPSAAFWSLVVNPEAARNL